MAEVRLIRNEVRAPPDQPRNPAALPTPMPEGSKMPMSTTFVLKPSPVSLGGG